MLDIIVSILHDTRAAGDVPAGDRGGRDGAARSAMPLRMRRSRCGKAHEGGRDRAREDPRSANASGWRAASKVTPAAVAQAVHADASSSASI